MWSLEIHDELMTSRNAVAIYISALQEVGSVTRNSLHDRSKLVLEKLLVKAESDPFDNGKDGSLLLQVDSNGKYNVISYPTCFTPCLDTIPMTALEILTREEDWSIPWNSKQVTLLCSLFLFRGEPQPCLCHSVLKHVSFWVTSTHTEVEVYLRAKSILLQKILRRQRITNVRQWPAADILHSTIHDGAETIALFTRHDYRGREVPWIRHRIKKLALIRVFLVDAMEIILTTWWHKIGAPPRATINQLDNHAARHSLRIVSIWNEALRNARRALERRDVETENLSQQRMSEPTARVPEERSETEAVWETDESDASEEYFSAEEYASQNDGDTEEEWETEDEWEEGHMLDKAVDVERPDDKNPQIRSSERHKCSPDMDDFDEDYWIQECKGRISLGACGVCLCRCEGIKWDEFYRGITSRPF